jgi:hypothetical protein
VYLLGRALVVRQEQMDRAEPGFAFNKIKYDQLGSANFVNPNFDVAYLEAWFDVDEKTPVILQIPQIQGRYYTAQILDEWGEVIANINERTFHTKPYGSFALVMPESSVSIPRDAGRIELHSRKAKLLARVELQGDPEGAVKLQHEFKVTAPGNPRIAAAPDVPSFNNQELIGVDIFDHVDDLLASALDVAPNAAEMQQKVRAVAAYAASSKEARAEIDEMLRKSVIPRFQQYALTGSAPYVHNWLCGAIGGNYGPNYRRRTAANYAGIWANAPTEAVYFLASRDSDGQPLNGSNSYVMRFPANALPQSVVNAYWSVILVGVPDYRVIPNPLKRYNFNNHSPLDKEPDGSLAIAIGPKSVAGFSASNWLPSAEGKPFSLTFRAYVPKEAVRTCQWTPPPLVKVHD